MVLGCPYGSHRSLEPKNGLPQTAWKLDTALPICDNELLIDVETLNVNSASFAQMLSEVGPQPRLIADKILNITRMRGKLHNPITGSGGMLLGRVKQIGEKHPAVGNFNVNDKIATMVSLTLTPLWIDKILNVNIPSGQIDVSGYAILFESGLYSKVPHDIPPRVLLLAYDEAGSVMQSYNLAEQGNNVAIVGAEEKIGALSMCAVRQKLGCSGKIFAIVRTEQSTGAIRKLRVADEVIVADTTDPLKSLPVVQKTLKKREIDLTIDCLNVPGFEMFSIMITRENGKVYFVNPATRYTAAALGAEGIGKDIDLLFYKGYIKGHADFVVQLLRKNPGLQEYLHNYRTNHMRKSWAINGENNRANTEMNLMQLSNISMGNIVIHSIALQDTVKAALRIAPYETTVLITGESGVGKEVIAQIIHKASKREAGPFLKINCAAIPESLIEAELFGYEKGSFTGALKEGKAGIFEAANGGTILLDELGEMSLAIQAKILRAIQEKEIFRVGGTSPVRVDVRIIAATNRDLKELVEKGKFREDLYYRINVVSLRVPPLRERKEAIPALVDNYLCKYNNIYGTNKSISPQGMRVLYDYSWPGNVRELENLIQRLILCQEENIISDRDILQCLYTNQNNPGMADGSSSLELGLALARTEKEIFEKAAKQYRTTREIAAALNTSQSTVVRKLKKYKLR